MEVLNLMNGRKETGVPEHMVEDHTHKDSKCDTDRKESNTSVYLLTRVSASVKSKRAPKNDY